MAKNAKKLLCMDDCCPEKGLLLVTLADIFTKPESRCGSQKIVLVSSWGGTLHRCSGTEVYLGHIPCLRAMLHCLRKNSNFSVPIKDSTLLKVPLRRKFVGLFRPNSVAEYRVVSIFTQKTEQETVHPNIFSSKVA